MTPRQARATWLEREVQDLRASLARVSEGNPMSRCEYWSKPFSKGDLEGSRASDLAASACAGIPDHRLHDRAGNGASASEAHPQDRASSFAGAPGDRLQARADGVACAPDPRLQDRADGVAGASDPRLQARAGVACASDPCLQARAGVACASDPCLQARAGVAGASDHRLYDRAGNFARASDQCLHNLVGDFAGPSDPRLQARAPRRADPYDGLFDKDLRGSCPLPRRDGGGMEYGDGRWVDGGGTSTMNTRWNCRTCRHHPRLCNLATGCT